MSALHLVLEIAGANHGVIATTELRTRGVSNRQIRTLVARGHLQSVGGRALVLAGYPATPWQRILVAAVGCNGIASHRSAALLHGIGRWSTDGRAEILSTRRPTRRLPRQILELPGGVTPHSTTNLPPDDIDCVRSIPCSSVARTLLSLAGTPDITDSTARALVDEAIRDGKASDRWLWHRLESLRRRGRPGVRRLEAILVSRAGGNLTESWLERQFLELIIDHGLPVPECQRRIELRGSFVARVDFAYEAARIAIEVNGHAFHSTADQLARDAKRRNQLQLARYQVLDFTYDQVVRHPDEVAQTVRSALETTVLRS